MTIMPAPEDLWAGFDAQPEMAVEQGEELSSWQPMDLGPYLRGEVQRPVTSVGMTRNDGLRMLYPGKEHAVIGEMESGKSWFAVACVAEELLTERYVVYIHFEEADPSDTLERLQALAVPKATIEKLFKFVGPECRGNIEAVTRLLNPVPALVVLDGVNEGMSLHGWKIREEDGAAMFRRHMVKPCTHAGAAVLSADHVVKDTETRGRYALGSIHKGNALTGALFVLENAEPFGRGMRGRSHVFVTKDRPGCLRREGRSTKLPGKTLLGELVVDDRQIRGPELELHLYATAKDNGDSGPDVEGSPDDAVVLAAVRDMISKGGQASVNAVRAVSGISHTRTDDALIRLTLAGLLIEVAGPRRARIFTMPDGTAPEASPAAPTTVPVTVPLKRGGTRAQSQSGVRTVPGAQSGTVGHSQPVDTDEKDQSEQNG